MIITGLFTTRISLKRYHYFIFTLNTRAIHPILYIKDAVVRQRQDDKKKKVTEKTRTISIIYYKTHQTNRSRRVRKVEELANKMQVSEF